MSIAFRIAFALVIAPLFATAALAQSGLEVSVFDDASKAPVPGIDVRLVNDAIGFSASRVTDERGHALFLSLSTAGEYRVEVAASSLYDAYSSRPIVLRTDRVTSVSIEVRPRIAGTEAVTVVGRSTLAEINTIDAEVSSTLLPEEVMSIPIEGRDITRALYRLPNVTQATGFYPEAPNVSINGANSLYANYLIDGLDNNENFLGGQKFPIPIGFVQDVTVLTSTYSSEYGRTGNGIFNVTSRSGSNELSGEVFYVTRPGDSVDASSSFAGRDLAGNDVKDGFQRQQFGVGVGGPIIKDRTFYYVNYERTNDDKDNVLSAPDLGAVASVPGENAFDYLSAKIDHVVNERLRASLRVNAGDASIERQGGGLDGGLLFPSAGSTQERESRVAAIQATYTGSAFSSETSLQWSSFDWKYAEPNTGGPQVSIFDESSRLLGIVGHPGFTFANEERTWHLRQRLSLARGRHTLRFGAELVSSDFALRAGGNPLGNYRVRLTAGQQQNIIDSGIGAALTPGDLPSDVEVIGYDVETRAASFGERQDIWSVWFEDIWALTPELNLTLGLRYDLDSISEGASGSADDDNLAPRFAANYQLDSKSAVRAGAGLFYEKVLYAIYSDALQQNTRTAGYREQIAALVERGILPANTNVDAVLFDGNVVASFDSVPYLDGPTGADLAGQSESVFSNERRILNPNGYENPATAQYTLGYQRQFRDDMLFYVDLIHTRTHHLPRLRNLNAPAPFESTDADPLRTQDEANATRPLADLGFVPGGALNIVMTEMAGRARYSAMNVTLLKDRGPDTYSYRLSYTLSKLENDTDDINFRAEDGNDFAAEWGPSLNDRRHVISGLFFYHPLPRLTLSLGALLQSGQPINRIPDADIYGTTDLNGDGRFFGDAYVGNSDRQPGESRNSDRLGWSEVFDLGIAYSLPIKIGELELRADVFNLFNHENLSGYSNNATQSNQIQEGPADSGFVKRNEGPRRQIQFGVRYVF